MTSNQFRPLPSYVQAILWSLAIAMLVGLIIIGGKDSAEKERAAIRQVYQDGYKAGAEGVALECPWSTWHTEARVVWNRGYVAGVASRNTPRNAAD